MEILLAQDHALSFLLAFIASMGTVVGGLLVVIGVKLTNADPASRTTQWLMGVLQAFSAGVMVYITCFDLVPEATEVLESTEAMAWMFVGVVAFGLIELLLSLIEGDHEEDHKKESGIEASDRRDLLRTSLISFIALALHNLPEGLGVYLSAMNDIRLGSQLAFAIMLHNVPEGMAVAIPLYSATGSSFQVIWWTLVNGLAEPFGVLVGGMFLQNYLTTRILNQCLAAVGGMMLCISIHELQPMAIRYSGKMAASVSFFFGMLICFAALETVEYYTAYLDYDHHH